MLKFDTLNTWGAFSSFENLPWDPFFLKTSGKPKEVKNDHPIMMKFGTLVDWMDIWGCSCFYF